MWRESVVARGQIHHAVKLTAELHSELGFTPRMTHQYTITINTYTLLSSQSVTKACERGGFECQIDAVSKLTSFGTFRVRPPCPQSVLASRLRSVSSPLEFRPVC